MLLLYLIIIVSMSLLLSNRFVDCFNAPINVKRQREGGGVEHMWGIRSPFMSPPQGILLEVLDPGWGHLKNGAEDLC